MTTVCLHSQNDESNKTDTNSNKSDNEDDLDDEFNPPVKISRPNNSSTNRISSCK